MNLVVCMKAVPASTEVSMDPVTHTIQREGGDAVWNPYDTAALELALRLKDERGATVSVLSMGIPATARLLEDALARGADEALLLSDRAFAGSDTVATCYALGLGIAALKSCDVVLCGKMAVDGDTAQIGPMLAASLDVPCATSVDKILSMDDKTVTVSQTFEGRRRVLEVPTPCVLTVDKDAADLRMASILGVLSARVTEVTVLTAALAGADPARCGLAGSPTQVVSCFVPEGSGAAVTVDGSPDEQAGALCALFEEVLA